MFGWSAPLASVCAVHSGTQAWHELDNHLSAAARSTEVTDKEPLHVLEGFHGSRILGLGQDGAQLLVKPLPDTSLLGTAGRLLTRQTSYFTTAIRFGTSA